jgi:hypothetical protein
VRPAACRQLTALSAAVQPRNPFNPIDIQKSGRLLDRLRLSVVRQAMILALAGVAIGAIAAIAATRTLRTAVYGVSTLDPATFVVVGVVLIMVAVAASLIPAVRALRLNAVAALRQ